MPYPNEHAARIKDPDQFDEFRRKNNAFKDGIHAIYGIKSGKSELQAIRFDAKKYTPAEAKKWLKDNDIEYLYFESASGEKAMEKRQYRQGSVREITEDGRTIRFTISDESIDRHNSIIKSDAWDIEAFKQNPIAGWGHDVYGGWRAPDPDNIIGTWDIWVEDKELVGDLTFEDADVNPKADKIFRKVKNGTLNAVSVGFLPRSSHKGNEKDGEERDVIYYDDVELAEVSVVPIPSNKNARKKALENGDIPELIEELVREALGDEYRDDLTLKGLFAILKGGDSAEVEKADTGEEIDTEAREAHLQKAKSINNYFELEEKYRNELKRDY